MFDEKLNHLTASSNQLAAVPFSTPRLYTALLLENQSIPIREAKPFEKHLFSATSEAFRTLRTKDGEDELEAMLELAMSLNEIYGNQDMQDRLQQISAANVDVLQSIANLTAQYRKLQEENARETTPEPLKEDGDDILEDITREESEIFALEQMLSEKREMLSNIQRELDELEQDVERSISGDNRDNDSSPDANITSDHATLQNINQLDLELAEKKKILEEQMRIYNELAQDEAGSSERRQSSTGAKKESSFDEIVQLWKDAESQPGDAVVDVSKFAETIPLLGSLLENLEKAQHHIINLDVLQQISSTLIDSCGDPEIPESELPRTPTTILAARILQMVTAAGGAIPLQDLKKQIGVEAVQFGQDEMMGVQAVYTLMASHLIKIDRSTRMNLVSLA
ncbi:hypothetical protein DFQ27_001205 [Actinomortierella ambigua]|uniref:Uncharacterized protein n=1 Tax=Actinomortierella ambigua TaxID=1343610 RepID=A0A9P6QCV9_9FUNG|nr:hypothetical protein DFQ27_001205 [Actinomortierella ambigua]